VGQLNRFHEGGNDMASMRQKIGVIGVGAVGSASLLSTVLRGVAREIVVVNRDPKRARGVVADVQYGAALSPAVDGKRARCTGFAGPSAISPHALKGGR
jgi:glutamyl-tRNA reductase